MDLIFEISGVVRCIYDKAADLTVIGSVDIKRASHVEPRPDGQ